MDKNENKKLTNRYPFLLPRNIFTDELDDNYDYSYIRGIGEIPYGWEKLFLQMCEELRRQLIRDVQLETFRFTQIKEKYNNLECYHNGCSEKAQRILDKYSYLSQYVCTVCGQPATYETSGYVASFCDKCWNIFGQRQKSTAITFKPAFGITMFTAGCKIRKRVRVLRQWQKYLRSMQ